ncbi:hypothetical protein D3C87_2088490 [compost metagenome]
MLQGLLRQRTDNLGPGCVTVGMEDTPHAVGPFLGQSQLTVLQIKLGPQFN